MKFKTLTIAAFIAVAASLSANAQIYWQVANGGTNKIAGSTTATYTKYINTVRARVVGIEQRWALMDSGTSSNSLHIDASIDGSAFVADALGVQFVAASGTTMITNICEVDASGYIAIRLRLENSNSVVCTNVWLAASTKAGYSPLGPLPVADGGTGSSTAAAARTALGVTAATGGSFSAISVSGQTNTDLTASLPVFTDANKVLVSKTAANTKTALGIQAGGCTTTASGIVTNAFTTAFSAAPIVVNRQIGLLGSITNELVVTTTNFILNTGVASQSNTWHAIGAP